MNETDLTVDAEAQKLIGKTITRIDVDSRYQRTNTLTFYFSDGSSATLDAWAVYADDSGLDLSYFPGPQEMPVTFEGLTGK